MVAKKKNKSKGQFNTTKAKKYYAISSQNTGDTIVRSWAECKKLTDRVSNVRFKSFLTEDEALAFLNIVKTDVKNKPQESTVPAYLKNLGTESIGDSSSRKSASTNKTVKSTPPSYVKKERVGIREDVPKTLLERLAVNKAKEQTAAYQKRHIEPINKSNKRASIVIPDDVATMFYDRCAELGMKTDVVLKNMILEWVI